MKIRTRIRRWWTGADLYDRAAFAVAYDPEAAGRAQAWAFIRKVHAEHPNPARLCAVPDCCDAITQKPENAA